MDVTLDCGCGGTLTVNGGQAGLRLPCPRCGEPIVVPNLAELRRIAGESARVPPATRVRQMVEAGNLPPAECIDCERSPEWQAPLIAECDRAEVESADVPLWIFLAPLLYQLMVFGTRRREVREYGHDIVVPTPVLLCDSCRVGMIPDPGQWRAKASNMLFIVGLLTAMVSLPIAAFLWAPAVILALWHSSRVVAFRRQLRRWSEAVPEYAALRTEYPRLVLHLGAEPLPLGKASPSRGLLRTGA